MANGTKGRVLVGMSGGVDSSAAAVLLRQDGYEVGGATFRLWPENGTGDIDDARAVCEALGIPHYILDFQQLFREKVVDAFAAAYYRAQTPNPCIYCNRYLKFPAFWEEARRLGYDCISTGHYSIVEYDAARQLHRLKKGVSEKKDQSYVLYSLTQELLAHIRMPLGPYTKEEVREIVRQAGLPVFNRPDSQDICFVPDGDYPAFIENYTGKPFPGGEFVDAAGMPLAPHKGIGRYTIGQRKGLGISLGKPAFVTAIDAATGAVTLDDNAALWTDTLTADTVNWLEPVDVSVPLRVHAKIRYAHKAAPATVTLLEPDVVQVRFDEPVRAITPGQSVAFYDGEYLLGGGSIR
ncbi:tRNA 2-thiouridine(34) synthase MnmA [Ruminococcaceae bacterium OttesenSCG-928-L11]|nr:tRNA 2-thiouridine(34) synthase MnmA [Ruminococcaceae bacterium OttesenSCG-928-L11]